MQGSGQCKDAASHIVAAGLLNPEERNLPFPKAQSRIHLQPHIPMGHAELLRDTAGAKTMSTNAMGFLAKDREGTEGQRNRHSPGTGDPDTR